MPYIGNFFNQNGTKVQVGLVAQDAAGYDTSKGAVVDSIPAEAPPSGQITTGMFYDTGTKEITYTYGTAPMSTLDRLSAIEQQQAQTLLSLVNGGLM